MTFVRRLAVIVALVLVPASLTAADLSLTLSLGEGAEVVAERYRCSNQQDYAVRYVNSGVNILALIEWNNQTLVFVNVLAASGARYVSGSYEWWSKGDEATLTNAMDEGGKLTCKAISAE